MPRLPLLALIFAACHQDVLPKDTGTPPTDSGCAEEETWYVDHDGDGYGDPAATVSACTAPAGAVADATDCDDSAAGVYPGAPEVWYDGADEDCSGGSDYDQDGDGYDRDAECDDLDPARYPDASVAEVWYNGIDENCDGNDGDQDGDGWYAAGYLYEVPEAYTSYVNDCWDDPAGAWTPLNGFAAPRAADVHPGATDVAYDGLDTDCLGDDDFDADRDGYRTDAWPDETGRSGDDCADDDDTVHPGAADTWYDGMDADCAANDDYDADGDGYDEAGGTGPLDCDDTEADTAGCVDYHPDTDGDGYGASDTQCLCAPSGAYTTTAGGDCDDAAPDVHPDAPEVCDGIDENCDGALDDGLGTLYEDADLDGFGDTLGGTSCTGTVSDHSDCDDGHADVHPGAAEVCDGRDQNCDGNVDEGLPVNYPDDDGDRYGSTTGSPSCAPGAPVNTDCNDANAAINPGAAETCNTIDDNCNGIVDDGFTIYYPDADGDGHGAGMGSCSGTGSPTDDDCDDADRYIYPGAPELCDTHRNDCTMSAWTTADEAGVASQQAVDGTWSDVTAALAAGSPSTAATWTLGNGASLQICPGTWYVHFITGTGVYTSDIVGVYGPTTTVLDGAGSAAVISTSGTSSMDLSVVGVAIENGARASGGGIYFAGGTLTLDDDRISANTATLEGGGLYAMNADVAITATTFDANTAGGSGGGMDAVSSTVTLDDVTFTANTVSGASGASGGGMAYTASGAEDLTITGCTFEDNSAAIASGTTYAGALSIYRGGLGTLTITSTDFVDNVASVIGGTYPLAVGGAIYAYLAGTGATEFTDTTFTGNNAVASYEAEGGAIYLWNGGAGAVVFTGVDVGNNYLFSNTGYGGALILYGTGGGQYTIASSSIHDNLSYNTSYVVNGIGGGLYVSLEGSTMVIDDTTFEANAATAGAGIYGSLNSGANLTVQNGSAIQSNTGYGVQMQASDSSSHFALNDSRIINNTSTGLYLQASGRTAVNASCTGTTSEAAGIYENNAYGVYGACVSPAICTFVASTCDFDNPDTGVSNRTYDVYMYGIPGNYLDDASFNCNGLACL